MVDITHVVTAVIGLVITIVSVYCIPFIKTKVSSEELNTIQMWVKIAVYAAEQIYREKGQGALKKEHVEEFLKSKGFVLNLDELDNLIEAAVKELKISET